jgi:hypothetical protein
MTYIVYLYFAEAGDADAAVAINAKGDWYREQNRNKKLMCSNQHIFPWTVETPEPCTK